MHLQSRLVFEYFTLKGPDRFVNHSTVKLILSAVLGPEEWNWNLFRM